MMSSRINIAMSTTESALGLGDAVEHSTAAFFLTKPDGTIIDANRSACAMFGYSKEELIRIGRQGIIDHSDPVLMQKLRERSAQGYTSGELIGIRNDGSRFPIEFSSVVFQTKAGDTYTSTFITDITDRKRAEREIQLLINNTAEAYILVDQDLRILSFNEQFHRLYHRYFGIDIIKGESILMYSPESRRANAASIYTRVLSGETVTSNISLAHPEDGHVHYLLTYAPATDETRQVIGAFVTATNITEQMTQQQRFHYVTKATSDAIWDWDLMSGIVFWGEGFHTTFGYPKDIVNGSADEWKNRMHPDDRDQIEALVREAIQSNAETVGAEYRYRKANGSYAIVSDRAVIVRNDKGDPIRLVGAMQDITITRNKERQRLLLAEIGQISAHASSLQTMIDHSLQKIVTYGGYLIGELWLVDAEEHFCYLTSDFRGNDAAVTFSNRSKDIRTFRKGEGLPGLTWESEHIQIMQNVQNDPAFIRREAAVQAGLHTFFGIPLVVHHRVVGILLLGSTDFNADLDILLSQFDRVGAFLGMEIHRKQQEDLLRRIAWEQSHLVRAPLARLLGLADLIRDGQESQADVDEMLAQIVSSAKELDHIIRGISSSTATIHPVSKP